MKTNTCILYEHVECHDVADDWHYDIIASHYTSSIIAFEKIENRWDTCAEWYLVTVLLSISRLNFRAISGNERGRQRVNYYLIDETPNGELSRETFVRRRKTKEKCATSQFLSAKVSEFAQWNFVPANAVVTSSRLKEALNKLHSSQQIIG